MSATSGSTAQPLLRPDRRLRADAARNHAAILAAARAAIEAGGAEVALEEVARRAGVAPSTLYRRFAGRDELVAAVLEDYVAESVEPLLADAAEVEDPWAALTGVLEGLVDGVTRHRGLLMAAKATGAFTPELTARTLAPLGELLARAQAAGVVRADLEPVDLPVIVHMAVVTAEHDSGRWPRYLNLLLDGMARRPTP
ncbi:transcriptional regulator [Actinomycetospora sp. NBRC 106375]|uniref:TetR/AcrR family transcriptional regulator n=1 Tax=Actinomycetospora sp. NBRC 106375 TaxID=3032207 RepID=UPI0024A1742E|nr:TetR/AcrR family transcriptional regulator [Actinomycetospora sp. NBRC 106375]GLZ47249.1 transcriptional regulator [Actinomycetospora sp. NBRC 106375]